MTKSHILQGISTTGVYYCKFYLRFSRFLPTFYVVLSKLRPLDNQCIAIKQNEWHGFYPIHLNFGWILGDSTTGVLLPHFFNCRVFCYNCKKEQEKFNLKISGLWISTKAQWGIPYRTFRRLVWVLTVRIFDQLFHKI